METRIKRKAGGRMGKIKKSKKTEKKIRIRIVLLWDNLGIDVSPANAAVVP